MPDKGMKNEGKEKQLDRQGIPMLSIYMMLCLLIGQLLPLPIRFLLFLNLAL